MGIIENVIKNVKKQYIKCNVCEKRGNVKVEFFTDYIKKTKEELICKNTEESIIEALKPYIKKNPKWFQILSFEMESGDCTYLIKMQILQKGERHKSGIDKVKFYVVKEKEKDEESYIWKGNLENPYEGDLLSQITGHPIEVNDLAPLEVLEILYKKLIETESLRVELPEEIKSKFIKRA